MPSRHAEKRERDRHDGYVPGFLIDERDEQRCSDLPTHAYRQSDWTGYAQQSAMCSSLKATAASNAYAVDARHRTGYDTTSDVTRRVMTTCATDADMDDCQSGTAYAIAYEPASDCETRLHRRRASDTSVYNDKEVDDVGLYGSSRPRSDTPWTADLDMIDHHYPAKPRRYAVCLSISTRKQACSRQCVTTAV